MLKSYFFIPSNNIKYIVKSGEIKADFFIFDLEDSVLDEEFDTCLKNLATIKLQSNHFVRFRFFDEENNLNITDFDALISFGFRRFVIPKFNKIEQIEQIKSHVAIHNLADKVDFIILIETPASLLHLYQTLANKLINVMALGFGSHDYCNEMEMQHNNHNLYFARQFILNHAKAFDIDTIDTVVIDINANDEFQQESLNAFQMGFSGKFVLHPNQLKILRELKYYTLEEIIEAEAVYDKIVDIKDKKTAKIIINGKMYETPHIKRIIKIIEWRKKYGSQ